MLDTTPLQNLIKGHENEEKYLPVKNLIFEIIWNMRFIADEKSEEEKLNIFGNEYFKSTVLVPFAEKLYRKAYETYQKAPFTEVKAILDEIEEIFMTRFPQKWQRVQDEFMQERIKNTPKPQTEYYDLNPNLFVETPPVKSAMIDVRTGEFVYYKDGTYLNENGETVPYTYLD